jgi:superfamily II DNA or RNA helicase
MPGSLTRTTSTSLRAWQRHALDRLAEWQDGPFLISAAPGAGKTRPALELARQLLAGRDAKRVVVLCPTTPLTRQWAAAAAALGVQLQPDAESADRHATSTALPSRTRASRAIRRRGRRRSAPTRS